MSNKKSFISIQDKRIKFAIVLFLILIMFVILGLIFRNVLEYNSDIEENNTVEKNDGLIDIPGFDKVTFKADREKQNILFYNPDKNNCYFQISIITDDGTVLWKSDMVKPNEKIENIELNKKLKKGSFSAIIKYDCFSLEDKSVLNGAEVKVTIDVI